MKQLIEKLVAQGWRVEERAKHYRAYPPDPSQPFVTLPKTPSDRRWLQNARSQLRKSGAVL